MTLYKIETYLTGKYGTYYVRAKDPGTAEMKVKNFMDGEDIGFSTSDDREIKCLRPVAQTGSPTDNIVKFLE